MYDQCITVVEVKVCGTIVMDVPIISISLLVDGLAILYSVVFLVKAGKSWIFNNSYTPDECNQVAKFIMRK